MDIANMLDNPDMELSFVNGIWVDKQFPLKDSYKSLTKEVYKANAETVDFAFQVHYSFFPL